MIIECKTCHSRFRLDESKITGKGIKVRCRNCGAHIVVLTEAASASPDNASDKKESFDQKSELPPPPPDNLIRFPKQASHTSTPSKAEDKSEIDMAFEQLFRKTTEETAEPKTAEPETAESKTAEPETVEPKTVEPKAAEPKTIEPKAAEPKIAETKIAETKIAETKIAEPKTAAVNPSQELPPFEPPTEVLRFDPPAELLFETEAKPDFQASAEEQMFDVSAELLPGVPKSFAFEDESFDLASKILTETSAMADEPIPSLKDKESFLKELETQSLPNFQASAEEQMFDVPAELPSGVPDSFAFEDDVFDMESEETTEPPAMEEQPVASFEDSSCFLKQFETQDLPGFQEPDEEQMSDVSAELPPDKPETSEFQDEAFDLAPEATTELPAMEEQPTQSLEEEDESLQESETQSQPDFQVSIEQQKLYMPTEFPFDDKPEAFEPQEEALDTAPEEVTTEPPAMEVQLTTSFEDDTDSLQEPETQNQPDFQVSIEQQTLYMPTEFPLDDKPETSELQDEALFMAPEEMTPEPPAMEEPPAQSLEEEDESLQESETQSLPGSQVPDEKQKLYMPIEYSFDDIPETSELEDEAFDTAPEVIIELPEPEEQPTQSFEDGDEFFKKFAAQALPNFQASTEEEKLDTPEELSLGEPESSTFEEFDTAPEVIIKPPATKTRPAQALEEGDDFFKKFEAEALSNFQAPVEEQKPDTPEELPSGVPDSFAFEDDVFDTEPEEATKPPAMEKQPVQSSEEEDDFNAFEAQIMQTFQMPAVEEEPMLDTPEEFSLGEPESSTFEEFDTAPEMTKPPATKTRPAQYLEEEDDTLNTFKIQMMQTFQMPVEEEPMPDTPEELPLDAPESSTFEEETFEPASGMTPEPSTMEEQPAQPTEEDDADFFKEFEAQILRNFSAPKEEKPTTIDLDIPDEFPVDPQKPSFSFQNKAPGLTPEVAARPPAINEQHAPSAMENNDISMAITPKSTDLSIERTAFEIPDEAYQPTDASEIAVDGNETPAYAYTPDTEPESDTPHAPKENTYEETPEQIYTATKPAKPPARKRVHEPSDSRLLPIAGAVLLLVLLGAAGYYFGFNEQGRRYAGNISRQAVAFLNEKVFKKTETSAAQYEVTDVIGRYYESGASSQKIFVISGLVTNLSSVGKSGIRIHASLLDHTGRILMEQSVYAGNVLSWTKIKTESQNTLEKALANPLGEHLINMDVTPGKSIPFMVLFFDAPESFRSYKIEANDSP